MSKKRIGILALIAALVMIGWLWWRTPPRAQQAPTEQATPSAQTASTSGAATPTQSKQEGPSSAASPSSSHRPSVQEELTIYNRPMNLWGKVVDQNGQPLGGVQVKLAAHLAREAIPNTFGTRVETITVTTGSDGRFQITNDRGSMLAVELLEKEGYEMSPRARESFHYYGREDQIFRPNPETPVVFHMWEKAGAEILVQANKFYGVVPDGRVYAIDVLGEKKTEGGNKGDFKVSIRRPEQVSSAAKYDWSCTIEGIGGGVIETQDEFMYRAPESGYQPRYEVNVSANDPQWSDRAKRQLYLKSREGKVYARLDVEILTNYQDKAVFSVKYYANPSGSRNLEYDPLQDVALSARPQTAVKP